MAVDQGRLYVSQQNRISLVEDGQIRDIITGCPPGACTRRTARPWPRRAPVLWPGHHLQRRRGRPSPSTTCSGRCLQDHDIPGADIVLTGQNYESRHTLAARRAVGAFVAWGTTMTPGQRIQGATARLPWRHHVR